MWNGNNFSESVSPQHFIGINLNGKFKMPTFREWNTFNRNAKRMCSGCMVIYKKMHRSRRFPIFVYFDVKQDRFLFSLRWSTQLLGSMFAHNQIKAHILHEKCFCEWLWTQAHHKGTCIYIDERQFFFVCACNRLINGHKFWTKPGSFQIIRAVFNLLRSFLIMT